VPLLSSPYAFRTFLRRAPSPAIRNTLLTLPTFSRGESLPGIISSPLHSSFKCCDFLSFFLSSLRVHNVYLRSREAFSFPVDDPCFLFPSLHNSWHPFFFFLSSVPTPAFYIAADLVDDNFSSARPTVLLSFESAHSSRLFLVAADISASLPS